MTEDWPSDQAAEGGAADAGRVDFPDFGNAVPRRRPPPQVPDHELIRVIGRGSYGEVWLARSVMGTLRAVKVVYRDTFEHRRPYEREFEGIQSYEPVSRGHCSQVAILHVGRHERDEYYYYVMELADDVNADRGMPNPDAPAGEGMIAERGQRGRRRESNPERGGRNAPRADAEGGKALTRKTGENFAALSHVPGLSVAQYAPRTLASDLQLRGKLPIEECITLGLSLATALEHLHAHGLIHRDIKPGNVIFVKGVAKLADVGLVVEMDRTGSFVGTRGYIPPEGPGTAAADVYSVGKVLYEISTGKDRNEFPDLPAELDDLAEQDRFLEFNEVLLKACHGDLRRRYASARELFEDLSLLEEGRSIRLKRSRDRWMRCVRRVLAGATLVLVAVLGGVFLARRTATPPSPAPRQLRVDDAQFWRVHSFPRRFDFSPRGDRIVFAGSKGLQLWDENTSITRQLIPPRFPGWRIEEGSFPRWSPDGQHVLFQALKDAADVTDSTPHFQQSFLLELSTGERRPIGSELHEDERMRDRSWLPDGKAFTYIDQKGRFYTQSRTGGRSLWVDSQVTGNTLHFTLGDYSRDGNWLLIAGPPGEASPDHSRNIWVIAHLGGRAVPLELGPGINACPTWGPDGQSIYFVSDNGQRNGDWGLWRVHVDPQTGAVKGPPEEVLSKPNEKLLHPRFVAGGRRLMYATEEPDTRIWLAPTFAADKATEVIRGQSPALSPDGRTVYYIGETLDQKGIFAVDSAGGSTPRRVSALVPVGDGLTRSLMSVSPDGALLAFTSVLGSRKGVFVLPGAGGEATLVGELTEGDRSIPVWSPDGHWLAYSVDKMLVRVSRDGRVRENMATLYRWLGWSVRWSPDGQHIAALGFATPEDWEERTGVFVVSVPDRQLRKLTLESQVQYKEGLEWHPSGAFLTYLNRGPEKRGSQVCRVYLDDRLPDTMIDQPDHWDYVGVWSSDGAKYFFSTSGCKRSGAAVHVYDARTGEIIHEFRGGWLPEFSLDGEAMVWTVRNWLRHFEMIDDFR